MKSILENIKSSVENLSWSSETKKQKAIDLCISIYNLYVYDGGDFNHYKPLGKNYFISIIKTKSYLYEIKDNLIDSGILEVYKNGTYILGKKNKCYRFNPELISGEYVALNGPKTNKENLDVALNGPKSIFQDLNQSINLSLSFSILSNHLELYHISGPKLETYINKGLQGLQFKPEVNDWISNFTLVKGDTKMNNEIESEFVNVVFDNDTYRYKIENALQLAKEQGLELIEYKDKCYIDSIDNFLIRKTNDLRLIFRKNIFDINNKIFRVSRNETNRRLDYNLTNMKSELLDYLQLDGEDLIELDISNAQFSILSYLIEDIDEEFKSLSKNGELYKVVDKQRMFRIAFDKIKSEHDDVRELFPKTMKVVDDIKKQYGYKYFSNILQNAESLIMIDGLMNRLIDLNMEVFPIHDAIRVKKSQVDIIKNEIELYFKEIGFECYLRNKNNKKEKIEITYKGFKNVLIDKPSQCDKKLFILKINELINMNIEPSESILFDMKIFDKETTWYMYNKWRKNNPYKENKND